MPADSRGFVGLLGLALVIIGSMVPAHLVVTSIVVGLLTRALDTLLIVWLEVCRDRRSIRIVGHVRVHIVQERRVELMHGNGGLIDVFMTRVAHVGGIFD